MSTYNNSLRRVNLGAVAADQPIAEYSDTSDTSRKVKMGFFRRKFMEWSKRAWEDSQENAKSSGLVVRSDLHRVDSEPQLNFKIYGATGGHIMEFARYDRKNDRYDNQLYIIPTTEDMGERVARVVNMEMMK